MSIARQVASRVENGLQTTNLKYQAELLKIGKSGRSSIVNSDSV